MRRSRKPFLCAYVGAIRVCECVVRCVYQSRWKSQKKKSRFAGSCVRPSHHRSLRETKWVFAQSANLILYNDSTMCAAWNDLKLLQAARSRAPGNCTSSEVSDAITAITDGLHTEGNIRETILTTRNLQTQITLIIWDAHPFPQLPPPIDAYRCRKCDTPAPRAPPVSRHLARPSATHNTARTMQARLVDTGRSHSSNRHSDAYA